LPLANTVDQSAITPRVVGSNPVRTPGIFHGDKYIVFKVKKGNHWFVSIVQI
jgi:hypothetical protein